MNIESINIMRSKTFGHAFLMLALSLFLAGCMANITVSVTGLVGTGLVLQNNGGDDLVIDADGSFTFKTQMAAGSTYAVTVKTQPVGKVCIVGNGIGTVGSNGSTINVQCATNTLQLLAGGLGGKGDADGIGVDARFASPSGVAVDGTGNVYVADTENHLIRKISPAGMVTTLAGLSANSGSADGAGADARFNTPYGIAVDSMGNVYVADTNNSAIRKISPAGVVTTLAGLAGNPGSADGTGAAARFNYPYGIAADNAGNVYVADTLNNAIRKITPAGVVTTLAGTASPFGSSSDGTGAAAGFYSPQGIAVDVQGNVYVADTYNQTIRKISPAGVVVTLAGAAGSTGSIDATGTEARFALPSGIALDKDGNVLVADTNNNRIRKISPAGVVTTLAGMTSGSGTPDSTSPAIGFNVPYGIAVDSAGNVYVANVNSHTIRKISQMGDLVATLAGMASGVGFANGTGAAAAFNEPYGLAVDSMGNVYVADTYNNIIRKVTPVGVVTTLAGRPSLYGGNIDGNSVSAMFRLPQGIAVDAAGNVYIADTGNSTIRKITPAGVVTTLAGGHFGYADGKGAAAGFGSVSAIAVDSVGNAYVADTDNHTIRKISSAGMVTTFAGAAGSSGSADGKGATARFNYPYGIATDGADNVYVADTGNRTVRKISPSGMVTTLAGMAGMSGTTEGTGATARFGYPEGIAADSAGNVYVADTGNRSIRKVSSEGWVSTVLGGTGKTGVQLGALPGSLGNGTFGVAVSDFSVFAISENSVLWAPKP